MTSKRLYYLLIGSLVILGVLSVTAVYFGDKMLQERTNDLNKLKNQSLALDEQQRSLVQAKRDIEAYSELESIAKTVVPQEKDQARTVREIVKIASASGVRIANIAFPSSELGDAKAKDNSQLEAVKGVAGLYQMDINVQSDTATPVSYQNFLSFLRRLEQNRRTAQVINLNVQPSNENRNRVTFNVVLRVFIKP